MARILISWIATRHDFLKSEGVNEAGTTISFHRHFYEDYDRHILLYSAKEEQDTRAMHLFDALRKGFPKHRVYPQWYAPFDVISLEAIQSRIEPLLLEHADDQIDLFISPGTPAMQTAWVLAHLTLNLNTRLLQVRPQKFTKEQKQPELLEVRIKRDALTASAVIREQLQNKGAGSALSERFCMTDTLSKVYAHAKRIAAAANTTVFITGESGTGKELLARYIHRESPRRKGPFLPINCAALSDELLESRLFGYKKGSFTGAEEDRKGIIESASGGTVFLDEIGDISPHLQQSLLRVLQEKEVTPIGGHPKPVDVRFISATNKDLRALCKAGEFRWDLYYRLVVTDLDLPELQDYPLQEKAQLLQFLTKEKQAQFRRPTPLELTKEIRDLILAYPFPGNIRELENILERLYALCPDRTPTKADLPNWILSPDPSFSLKLEDVIQEHVQRVFETQGGNQKKTAEVLGISYNTLRKRLGLQK